MNMVINTKRDGQWQEAPPEYLAGYNFAGAMLELQGRDVIAKVSGDLGTCIICGTPALIAATKSKHPDAVQIATVAQWEGGTWSQSRLTTDFATFAEIIAKHFPHRLTEYFPQVWTDAMQAIAASGIAESVIEIKEAV